MVKMPKYFFFDIETTGLPVKKREGFYVPSYTDLEAYQDVHPVSIGWIADDTSSGGDLGKAYHLLKPDGYTIYNSCFHGITQEKATEEGISYDNFIQKLEQCWATDTWILVGHNIEFDQNVLANALLRRNRQDLAEFVANSQTLCTMNLAKRLLGFRRFPKLTELYKQLVGKDLVNAHNAQADIEATYECFQHMLPRLTNMMDDS